MPLLQTKHWGLEGAAESVMDFAGGSDKERKREIDQVKEQNDK